MKKLKKRKSIDSEGFTLVELIVVIVIILILAAVLVPNVLRYVSRSQAAACAENRHSLLVEISSGHAFGDYSSVEDAFNVLYDENEKNKYCPNSGTYRIKTEENGAFEITCDKHSDVVNNNPPSGGNVGDGTGFGMADSVNAPQVVKDFFANNWDINTDQKSVSFKYKSFTVNEDGVDKTYYLVMSNDNLDNGSVLDKIPGATKDNSYIAGDGDGEISNTTFLKRLTNYFNSNGANYAKIQGIKFSDGKITEIQS